MRTVTVLFSIFIIPIQLSLAVQNVDQPLEPAIAESQEKSATKPAEAAFGMNEYFKSFQLGYAVQTLLFTVLNIPNHYLQWRFIKKGGSFLERVAIGSGAELSLLYVVQANPTVHPLLVWVFLTTKILATKPFQNNGYLFGAAGVLADLLTVHASNEERFLKSSLRQTTRSWPGPFAPIADSVVEFLGSKKSEVGNENSAR